MSKKRILIIYSTAGAGHKKAAFAIKEAFDELNANVSIDIIDALDHTSAFFKFTYPRIYIYAVNRIPYVWGLSYYLLDNRVVYRLLSWIRHFTNWIHTRPLAKFLRDKDYDVVIATHFLPPDVMTMEGKKKIRSYLINVVTDFRMHTFWYADATDIYVVAQDLARRELTDKYGVSENKIRVLGIPTDPVFSRTKDRDTLIRELGLKKDLYTVLVGSGGFGVGPIEELVQSFKGVKIPMQLLVVCGKNDTLCLAVQNLSSQIGIPVKSYGFVDNMDELMEISDVVVSKTGGMMSSEALAKGLPIIGIAPIPGQETRNFETLIRVGVAIDGRKLKEIPGIIENLYKDKDLRDKLMQNIRAVRRPNAAIDIAKLAITCHSERSARYPERSEGSVRRDDLDSSSAR